METIDANSILKPVIDAAQASFQINEGDYKNEDGLYICGKCGKPKQTIIMIPERRIVHCSCDCDLKKIEEEKVEIQKQEEMRIIGKLKEASMMDEVFKGWTFDNFDPDKYNEKNLRLCKRYATGFDEMVEKNQGLLMYGGFGTGKSFAAACIANYLLDRKVPVVMVSIPKLVDLMMNGEDSETTIINRINKAKLAIFDDLGAERNTAYAKERVYNVIDSRYRKMLPMIVTTNFTIDDMQNITDTQYGRIFSRILQFCYPMPFNGPDRRRIEAEKRFKQLKNLMEDGGNS